MNSVLYPGLSVRIDVLHSLVDFEGGPWVLAQRFQATIHTDWPSKMASTETKFMLEGVAVGLVVPGVSYEKDVLRPGTKRVLTRSR